MSDAFWALFMVAWTALGTVKMFHDVEEYRWQQRIFAEFEARMPKMIGAAPYDPAVGERLITEAAGCVVAIAAGVLGIRRRRRRVVEMRVKWIPTSETRAAAPVLPMRSRNSASVPTVPPRAHSIRKAKSGPVAAERLSAVVWDDHAARLEKEPA